MSALRLTSPFFVVFMAATLGSIAGCSPPAGSDVDTGVPDAEVGPDAEIGPDGDDAGDAGPAIRLEPVRSVEHEGFSTSKNCESCHSNTSSTDAMRDSEGRPVGFFDLWEASMMANAARDPFWRATVSAEVEKTPGASDEIEDKCLRCHTPMAYHANRREGSDKLSMDVLSGDAEKTHLALDGVSCAGCHQIEADGLGTDATFNGNFEVSSSKVAYGPFSDVYADPMQSRGGFEPKQGKHIEESGFCGSCHTLYTDPVDAQGNSTAPGHFPEQTPFLEWKNSKFGDGDGEDENCQSCHEPRTDRSGNPFSTQIARSKLGSDYSEDEVPKRSRYGRHLFVGGNTLVPQMLRDFRDALQPQASRAAFDELIERVRRQLENRTATLRVADTRRSGEQIEAEFAVDIETGHKFPTGYPSRRAWLHVEVTDSSGDVVFESGAADQQGRIVGSDGEPLAFEHVGGPIEPHHTTVESADQVQIYQSVMEDADGSTTFRLIRASDYRKDNRLLPKGWEDDHPEMEDIAPVGVSGDANFGAGGDRVTYRVELPEESSEPYQVRAHLYYQPLGHRWARELFEVSTPAVRDFRYYWRRSERAPETIDSASANVP